MSGNLAKDLGNDGVLVRSMMNNIISFYIPEFTILLRSILIRDIVVVTK